MGKESLPPKILTDVGLSMFVNTEELRDFDVPISEINIQELLWHFDMPVWEKDGTDDWNLTPWEVVHKENGTTGHQKRVQDADLQHPLIITRYRDRFVILDGVHRLVKAYMEGCNSVKVKVIPYGQVAKRIN